MPHKSNSFSGGMPCSTLASKDEIIFYNDKDFTTSPLGDNFKMSGI
jgi:hypothetical protein